MKKYDKYKDSGIEWLGEIPVPWDVKKLKYVANANPSNIDKKSKEDEQDIFLCNYIDVYKNDFINSEIPFMKSTASKSQIEKFILKKGDVIATKDSETPDDIGNPALVLEDFKEVACGYHLTHIKPKAINGGYLFRYLKSQFIKSYFEVAANGITRYGLGVNSFNSTPILIPPVEEQTAIANFLDRKTAEIHNLITRKEKLLKLYDEEKTAIINEAVTKGINPNVKMKDSGVEWLGEIPEHWEVKKLRPAHTPDGIRRASIGR
ncbi:MAG: restriction endonuclease subunit S, partial [Candidatus Cloacimonetes bacterium]|nr:restriction endonuclease subunit S [Candidatus Cloacimonadota bacterium]